jgi:steroid delta-isomerase
MQSAADKIAVVEKYMQVFATRDTNLIKEIYAEDATVEDPVGSGVHHGIVAILTFYEDGLRTGAKLELTGPVRCAGNAAAFPFCVSVPGTKIHVIDVFEFNSAGKVASMKAYWGPENITTA